MCRCGSTAPEGRLCSGRRPPQGASTTRSDRFRSPREVPGSSSPQRPRAAPEGMPLEIGGSDRVVLARRSYFNEEEEHTGAR